MVYKKYGQTFQQIRKQFGISLAELSTIGIQKSTLSNFERGKSMMTFDKVILSLQYLGVSLEDFENFLNRYNSIDPLYLLDSVEEVIISNQSEKLPELLRVSEQEGYKFISLAIKSVLGEVSSQETEEIVDYLYRIDVWSYKELCIFYLVIESLKSSDIIYLLRNFFKNNHDLFNSKKYQSYVGQLSCNAVVILSDRCFKDEAKEILDNIKGNDLANTMFVKTLLIGAEGYWTFLFSNKEKGREEMIKALNIIRLIDLKEVTHYYEKKYEKIIDKIL